jgi:pyruvate,water dikinase
MEIISMMIQKAKKADVRIGLCGQAPSDFPEYAKFLVQEGIDSISFNTDALIRGIENIKLAEAAIK